MPTFNYGQLVGLLRITAWNILQGGGDRVSRILDALEVLNTDMAILGEWRSTSPNDVLGRIKARGFVHTIERPDPAGGYAAVLVASRRPFVLEPCAYVDDDDGHRFSALSIEGVSVGAAYVPGSEPGKDRKKRFWEFLLSEWAPTVSGRPALLIGDLNTGKHYRDELGATFTCSEYLDHFEALGWRDAWIERNARTRPPATWTSSNGGNPFRLDHALVSASMPKPKAIEYPEIVGSVPIFGSPRISDHLPVTITLRT